MKQKRLSIKDMHETIKSAYKKMGKEITDYDLITYKRGEMIETYCLFLDACLILEIDPKTLCK